MSIFPTSNRPPRPSVPTPARKIRRCAVVRTTSRRPTAQVRVACPAPCRTSRRALRLLQSRPPTRRQRQATPSQRRAVPLRRRLRVAMVRSRVSANPPSTTSSTRPFAIPSRRLVASGGCRRRWWSTSAGSMASPATPPVSRPCRPRRSSRSPTCRVRRWDSRRSVATRSTWSMQRSRPGLRRRPSSRSGRIRRPCWSSPASKLAMS